MSSSPKKRILFADDDQRVLRGLRRQLYAERDEWEMTFVPGGPEALLELGTGPFDAVVSDMRMPMVDGAQVLAHVAFEHPRAARLVLSGNATPDRQRLASSCAHRYLNKPCDPDVLRLEVRQALAMRGMIDELGDARLDRIWSQPPGFLEECEEALAALKADQAMLSNDVLTAAQTNDVLWERVCESLAAARGEEPDEGATPREAVHGASTRMVLSTILAVRFLELVESDGGERWRRAIGRAVAALGVARDVGLGDEAVTDAFVGSLLSAFVGETESQAQLDVLAYLLPTWGFSEPVVDVLTRPEALLAESARAEPCAFAAVLAGRLAAGEELSLEGLQHLVAVGWDERIDGWRAGGERVV